MKTYTHVLPTLMVLFLLSSTKSECQITVDFEANQTEGCGSVNASFNDLSVSSAGIITSWTWDLDGLISNSASPGHIYTNSGSYTICLTVQDNQGNEGTLCKDNYITVHELPTPDFSADILSGCIPMEVHFQDLSLPSNTAAINQWIWGLGGSAGVITDDGTATDISTIYDSPDSYTISLTITDDNNCTNTITKPNYIQADNLPTLDVSAAEVVACIPPFQADFTNNSVEPGVTYTWDFGNGTTFNGPNPPSITYGQTGLYTVTIIAETMSSGCADTLVLTDYIQVGKLASFTYTPEEGCKDLLVEFTDTSPEPADSVWWNFGDGNTSNVANPTHLYITDGCFVVSLLRYVDGCVSSINSGNCIEVYNTPVAAYDIPNPLGCVAPHTVAFENLTTNGVSFEWDFGDGNTSTETAPTHTYTDYGVYPVLLTATSVNGCEHTAVVDTVRVFEIESELLSGNQYGCTPLSISLASSSNSFTPIVNWEWDVVNFSNSPPSVYSSTDEFPNLVLIDTGRYEIRLIITNSLGCQDTSYFLNRIGVGMEPVVNFMAMPDTACVNDVISFSDLSSSYVDEWLWQFGDGGSSADQNPVYEYNGLGPFDVSLQAFHLGCMGEFSIEEYIYINPPLAGFNVNTSCIDYLTIELTDISQGATSLLYDFGVEGVETDTSSSANPIFTFPDEGEYLINQYVFNDTTGCVDTTSLGITIGIPVANFDMSPKMGCAPLEVLVEDMSSFANDYEFEWLDPSGGISNPVGSEPIIIFENPGIYTNLQLLITDINGCQDSITFTDTIFVNGVDAQFDVFPSAGCRPLLVDFADNSSSLFGNVNAWEYQLTDIPSTVLTDQNSSYNFETNGYYDVTFVATDDWGCSDTLIVDDAVFVSFPTADFEADTFGCTKSMVSFSTLAQGLGLSYLWNFGDGTTSTEVNPMHLYQQEGSYTVCLELTDINGCQHTTCKDDYVLIADPMAAFEADSTSGYCPPLLVNFDNNSQHASTYEWDFGDNSGLSNLENAVHVYTEPGVFDVTLIAHSIPGCSDTLHVPQLINLDGPVGSFLFDRDTSCAPAPITFVATSIDNYDYTWDFGNGDLQSTNNVDNDSIVYTYMESGHYVPKLILEDGAGCQRVLESPDTIVIASLEIDFLALDTALCGGENFTNFINTTVSSEPVEFIEWTFEGATPATSNFNNVGVEYDQFGSFDVQLVIDNGICHDTLMRDDYIHLGALPEVAFESSPSTGCTPLPVQFTDLSTVEGSTIESWNWDFGSQNTSTEQNPLHVFDDQSTSTFPISLTVTSAAGCEATGTDLIVVLPLPEFTLPIPSTICQGETADLIPIFPNDTIGYTYSWQADPTLSCTDCFSPQASPMDTTTYTLVTTNSLGCTFTQSVNVNVRPFAVPVITLTADTTICLNSIIQLQATGGDDINSYQWDSSIPGLSCYDQCFNPVATPQATSTYVVTVTNEGGCSAQDSVTVEVDNEFFPFAGADRTICEGDSVQLTLTSGNDPQWTNPEDLTCAFCADPMAFPSQDMSYTVVAVTDNGCEIRDTVEVEVIQPSDVDAGGDLTICNGESTELAGLGEGMITWSPSTGLQNTNTLTPMANPLLTTTYYMEVVNGECTMRDSVTIQVNENTEISSVDMTICQGDSVTLDVLGAADTYSWEADASLSRIDIQDPVAFPTETTTYTVTGQLATCNPDTATATVFVDGAPQFRTSATRFFAPGQTVELVVYPEQEGALLYEWIPATGLSCDDCATPTVTPDSTTSYQLIVTDAITGCVEIRTVLIQELYSCPEELFGVPNAFSPNGDGFNDELELKISPSIESIESFQIFNRWGALVFETNDRYASWDGTYKGQLLSTGVYVYMLKVKCQLDGETILKRGDITLVK